MSSEKPQNRYGASSVKQPPADLAERLWQVSDRFLALGSDVKVDDLAELSGVPRATIYYYFSGKDDVMAFLLAQKVQHAGGVVAEAAATQGSVIERTERVLRVMLREMANHPSLCTRLLCWMTTPTAEQLVIDAQGSLLAPLRALFIEGQASGELAAIDPVDATTAVMGALSMVAMRHTITGDFDADAIADSMIPWLLDGLRGHEGAKAPGSSSARRSRART
jgi:AcrR family transcriptional regulator